MDDMLVTRNRGLRKFVALASPPVITILGGRVGLIAAAWFDLPLFIGWAVGLAGGAYLAVIAWGLSTIENDVAVGFVTIDPIVTLFPSLQRFGLTPVVPYATGKHWCFWWESRTADNVVNLVEVAEPVVIPVQTDTGDLTLTGEVRYRPNGADMPTFLTGAAAVASDATGIVKAFVLGEVTKGGKSLREILKASGEINDALKGKFQENKTNDVTEFEGRFAVTIGDVTISGITPSRAVAETLAAVTESELMDEMVAKSFGCANYAELMTQVRAGGKGVPTLAQVNQVRTQKMAASGNLQGMELKDHTFNLNLSGLDTLSPEAASAFGTVLGRFGGTLPAIATGGGGKSNRPRRNKGDA